MNRPRMALVIEDDLAIRRGIVDALQSEGYATHQAGRGDDGLRDALEREYDVLLLDLILPIVSGLEILGAVRDARPSQPVIILTALGDETDRVRGLKLGADDYVVKPFSVNELLARVEAVLRRSPQRPQALSNVAVENRRIDFNRREVRFEDGTATELSEREAEVLNYLVQNPGRIISRQELLQRVWRLTPEGIATRTIDMHVARLRDKLRDDPGSPRIIVTVHGKGYRFGPETT